MPTLTIDGTEVTVEAGTTVLQACEEAGVEVPRFCYHERLSIAGNCRMCLVEMERAPKPIASCAMPVGDGMVIHTNTEKVKKAREGVMEFLLINHPLDCPICDQGGECDLQDQAVAFGRGSNRYDENKRAVPEKYMGPLIDTTMTRCIHCMRCVRFSQEVAGVEDMGSLWRGEHTEVTTYLDKVLDSELSGNVIDLCPVGALTSKPYAFTARSWELTKTESIDVMDALGSNIRIDARGAAVMRILPRLHEEVNEEWISDKTRFVFDGLKKRRLDKVYVKSDGVLKSAAWEDAFKAIANQLDGLNGTQIAGLVGELADMESMYALKDFLKGFGSDQIEHRQTGSKLEAGTRAGYTINGGLTSVEDADVLLLIGANPRLDASVFNARIRGSVIKNGLKVLNLGAPADLTYPVQELGTDAGLLTDILAGKGTVAELLSKAKRPMILIGAQAYCRTDGAALLKTARDIADKYCVSEDWTGFGVLQTAASSVAALDLGLTVDGGLAALAEKSKAGELKLVFNLGADEFDMRQFAQSFVIYIGSHGDKGAENADIILPAAAYTEKSGTYVNTEGRAQRTEKAVFAPGDAREDWKIFRALSEFTGKKLAFNTLTELRQKLFKEVPAAGEEDVLSAAEWSDFGIAGPLSPDTFTADDTNYYLTNPIARASSILASVIEARHSAVNEEATGTHG